MWKLPKNTKYDWLKLTASWRTATKNIKTFFLLCIKATEIENVTQRAEWVECTFHVKIPQECEAWLAGIDRLLPFRATTENPKFLILRFSAFLSKFQNFVIVAFLLVPNHFELAQKGTNMSAIATLSFCQNCSYRSFRQWRWSPFGGLRKGIL